MDPLFVTKKQKKTSGLEKTRLYVSYGPKNMLSVEEYLEILCGNNHLPNQLHLSSKIERFESQSSKILEILTRSY